MKHILLALSFLAPVLAFSQSPVSTGDALIFFPVSGQRVHVSDSVQVYATLTSNVTISSITWIQVSGPAIKFQDSTTYYGNGTATNYFKMGTSNFWLQGLAPGLYVFKATGKSASGATAFATVSLTVIADPVCPPIPAPRMAASVTLMVGGISVTIPASALKILYSDGTNQ